MRQVVVHVQCVHLRQRVAPRRVNPLTLLFEKWAFYTARKTRPQQRVEHGKRQRSTRAQETLFRKADRQLQALRTSLDARRQQLVPIEKVKHCIGDAQRATKLPAAPDERCSLLSQLFDPDAYVGGTREFVCLDPHILFFDGFEVTRPCQARQAGFQGSIVQRPSLLQRNAASEIPVWKTAIPQERQ